MRFADLVSIKASLLTSISAVSAENDCFNMEGAFYMLLPFQARGSLEFFSFRNETPKEFFAGSALVLAVCESVSVFEAFWFRIRGDAVRYYDDSSRTLLMKLTRKCLHSINIPRINEKG